MEYNNAEFLFETEVPSDQLIVSRTDLSGTITYANETFLEISGYSKEELIGKKHNVVRHPDMPDTIFQDLWETLQKKRQWNGNIKNLRKDNGFYWVHATVSGVYKDGMLVEYKSIRVPLNKRNKMETQKKYDLLKKQNNEKTRHIVYK